MTGISIAGISLYNPNFPHLRAFPQKFVCDMEGRRPRYKGSAPSERELLLKKRSRLWVRSAFCKKSRGKRYTVCPGVELMSRFELPTSSLPMKCSTY